MPSASYNKFEGFVGYLGTKVIDLNADLLNAYLSAATPSASGDNVKVDLAEIATGGGYTGPQDSQNTYSESGGTGTLVAIDWTVSATAAVASFQYVVHYDDTVTTPVVDPLMCWHDYGSAVTLGAGESFTCDYGTSLLTLS
jgi:hypothetical protein